MYQNKSKRHRKLEAWLEAMRAVDVIKDYLENPDRDLIIDKIRQILLDLKDNIPQPAEQLSWTIKSANPDSYQM